ncbi:transcription factor HES-1-like isoform X1 [Triplophysa rosa]|uniref:Transcription factor HES-1-like n=1 Tax=Triplophysa rosa TaxID=992332 RepID=A0A9W8C7X5_TRIRA|nr:transcription factor HES-1-like isoform X1 [Triplophysa rosa]KAI7809997.1 putative transcription factor HES-1-like [Triplophysa rosa]
MTSHHITCKLSGHEQRCALDMTRNTTSENHSRDLQHRKSSKPIMEKRRRARINDSLTQLKSLILDALNKETSKHSKLDKADILEITVKHLKNLQRAQMTANSLPMLGIGKYRAGFCECINEVIRFLSTHEGVDTEVKTRLLSHLASCVSHMDLISCHRQHHLRARTSKPGFELPQLNAPLFILPKLHHGFRLVPSSDGTFGLLIPSSSSSSVTGGHNGAPLSGVSPSARVNAQDSLWRPW